MLSNKTFCSHKRYYSSRLKPILKYVLLGIGPFLRPSKEGVFVVGLSLPRVLSIYVQGGFMVFMFVTGQ